MTSSIALNFAIFDDTYETMQKIIIIAQIQMCHSFSDAMNYNS